MFLVVENERQIQVKWIEAILAARKWRPNRLATEAGVDPSALSRFLHDKANRRTLNSYTVEKIEAASGFTAYEVEPSKRAVSRFGAVGGDAAPYEPSGSTDIDRAVVAISLGRNSIEPWVLLSRCLESAGYLPGDTMLFDTTARPARGDIVVAQVFGRGTSPEFVVRKYAEPFLYSVTIDENLMEPILVDKNVVILGTLVSSLRSRQAA